MGNLMTALPMDIFIRFCDLPPSLRAAIERGEGHRTRHGIFSIVHVPPKPYRKGQHCRLMSAPAATAAVALANHLSPHIPHYSLTGRGMGFDELPSDLLVSDLQNAVDVAGNDYSAQVEFAQPWGGVGPLAVTERVLELLNDLGCISDPSFATPIYEKRDQVRLAAGESDIASTGWRAIDFPIVDALDWDRLYALWTSPTPSIKPDAPFSSWTFQVCIFWTHAPLPPLKCPAPPIFRPLGSTATFVVERRILEVLQSQKVVGPYYEALDVLETIDDTD